MLASRQRAIARVGYQKSTRAKAPLSRPNNGPVLRRFVAPNCSGIDIDTMFSSFYHFPAIPWCSKLRVKTIPVGGPLQWGQSKNVQPQYYGPHYYGPHFLDGFLHRRTHVQGVIQTIAVVPRITIPLANPKGASTMRDVGMNDGTTSNIQTFNS